MDCDKCGVNIDVSNSGDGDYIMTIDGSILCFGCHCKRLIEED